VASSISTNFIRLSPNNRGSSSSTLPR
jgi:hypothetical protein